jgi:YbbR domain-containing protein
VTGGGQTAIRAIATNGTSTFTAIPTGSYQVQLTPSSVAANCTVTSPNPQTANVPAGGTATVTFTVSCTTGTITISNQTTGSNLDPDGYTVTVTAADGTVEIATMATNGSVTGDLSTGSYQVQLTSSSVAANCTVTSPNPQTANVPAGGTTTVTFALSCSASTP